VITKDCGEFINHGVLAVGYGVENGVEYFLVKNSWADDWGDNGYVKIAASADNVCGILLNSSYPKV
jgi:C1A family cysteine protease